MNMGAASLVAVACALALPEPAQAQRTKREVGAHVHGASKLDLAVEGQTILMELSAPANDIIGFETLPQTDKQRATVEQAMDTLRDPLRLFTPSPAAGCTVASASAELVFGEGRDDPASEEAGHAEFRGRYSLVCKNVAALQGIDFPYFKAFPRTDEVEVQVIAPGGQKSSEVKKARPRLSLRPAS